MLFKNRNGNEFPWSKLLFYSQMKMISGKFYFQNQPNTRIYGKAFLEVIFTQNKHSLNCVLSFSSPINLFIYTCASHLVPIAHLGFFDFILIFFFPRKIMKEVLIDFSLRKYSIFVFYLILYKIFFQCLSF